MGPATTINEPAQWTPTKYSVRNGRLRGTRDRRYLRVGSRIISDIVAGFYDSALKLHAAGRLLDLGCGKAPLFGTYRPLVETATRVDWEASEHGEAHVDIAHDLTKPLPFADGSFDTVILSDVLEHVSNPQECIDEIGRVLAPGGKLIMNTPFYYWLHEEPHDYYRYTRHALALFMREAGLEVVDLQPLGGAIEVLLDISGKLLDKSAASRWLARALPGFHAALMATPIGPALQRRTGEVFPLGYALVARKPA